MVKCNFLKDCSEIDQSKFKTENWYLMGWGMGDGLNATLFLESQSPVPYKILCPPRNFNGVKFILDNFVVGEPKCTQVDVYPLQDGYPVDQDTVLMSKHGFGPQSVGTAHNLGQLKVVHYPPKDWFKVQNLEGSGILKKIQDYDNVQKTIKEKTCILFPERGDSYQLPDEFWNTIVGKLKEKGYKVYVNWTKKTDVLENQKIFEGTEKLDKLEIQELFDFVIKHENIITLGQKAGIFDFLKYLEHKKIVFYADVDYDSMPDPSRSIYEWCNLEEDSNTRNNIEIRLSKYDPGVLDLIID